METILRIKSEIELVYLPQDYILNPLFRQSYGFSGLFCQTNAITTITLEACWINTKVTATF